MIEKRANEPDAFLFLARACFSRGRVFSFPPRRGTPPRARESHPPRVNSARTRRALDGRVLTRPESYGAGTRVEPGPVFVPALNQPPTTSSLSSVSSLFRHYCHSRQSASPSCYRPPLQLQQQVRTHFVSKPRKRSITSTSTAPSL